MTQKRRVVVTGVGLVSPVGIGTEELFDYNPHLLQPITPPRQFHLFRRFQFCFHQRSPRIPLSGLSFHGMQDDLLRHRAAQEEEQHQHRRALADYKAVALLVKWTAGALGGVIG